MFVVAHVRRQVTCGEGMKRSIHQAAERALAPAA